MAFLEPTFVHLVQASLLLLILYLSITRPWSKRNVSFPPGPPSEPLIGHLRVIPTFSPERTYMQWSKEFNSDVLGFRTLGQHIVVLNSVRAATDLFDKRGAIYCDRPRFVLFELMGFEATLTFLQWGPRFQLHRRALQSAFTKPKIVQYQELQTTEARRLVRSLMRDPTQHETLLRRFATAIVMSVAFGHTITRDDDPYIQLAVDASYALGHGGAPAGTPVDFFPPLRHLPNFLAPLSRSLKFARDWRWAIRGIHELPFAETQRRMKEGTAEDSFIRTLLEEHAQNEKSNRPSKGPQMTIADIQGAAGAIYAAGQDTTWSTLVVFLLNMIRHPEIARQARKEIDAAIGTDRLPDFGDRDALPCIGRIVQETLRWAPVSPIGVPHRSIQDDEYRGWHIPKGSLVFANARAMCYDESLYQEPERFEPDRYISTSQGGRGEPFPVGQFGLGRRACVGKYIAEASVWIVAATMLATLDIGKAVDADGKDIYPDPEFTDGLTCHPMPFECKIAARSRAARDLIDHAMSYE